MEMEKVMAKLKSLEDQLLREVLEKEFAGHKAVPQLDMRSVPLSDWNGSTAQERGTTGSRHFLRVFMSYSRNTGSFD